MRVFVAMTALVIVCGATGFASADADVEVGCRLVNRGEFRDALAVLAEAEASTDLDREALVRLLECRALARFATRDLQSLEQDLVRLVSLDPGYALSDEFGPEVHASMARVRARGVSALAVSVAVERGDGRVRIEARVEGDEGDLVREVRVRARVGRGAWRTARDVIELPAGADATATYEAMAIGPGGAEIERTSGVSSPSGRTRAPGPSSPERRGVQPGPVIWPWALAGALAAVAIGVTVAVVVSTSGSDRTQPSAPVVAW